MKKAKTFLLITLAVIFLTGLLVVYSLFVFREDGIDSTHTMVAIEDQKNVIEDTTIIKVFYPAGLSLQMSEIKIKSVFEPIKLVRAALHEFFSRENIIDTGVIPEDTKILGVYAGTDKVLYIDLSKDFQRSFHGDIVDEFMLLKSIYETVMSNIEIEDVKILIQGEEEETLGGHFFIKFPLKNTVTQIMRIEGSSDEVR